MNNKKKKTIWCLFSVDNQYDQPDNCLQFFWFEKPEGDVLYAALKELELFIDED